MKLRMRTMTLLLKMKFNNLSMVSEEVRSYRIIARNCIVRQSRANDPVIASDKVARQSSNNSGFNSRIALPFPRFAMTVNRVFRLSQCDGSLIKLFGLIIIVSLLSGCFSAAVSGVSVVYDRYNLNHKLSNHAIGVAVSSAIKNNPELTSCSIETHCFDYQILLTGQVTSEQLRKKAAEIASRVQGVEHVYNFIEDVDALPKGAGIRDTWITTRIKSRIISEAKMNPSNLKVVTENRTVYLMGVLPRNQAKLAVEIARYTPGVKHVVQIFKYVLYSKQLESEEPG